MRMVAAQIHRSETSRTAFEARASPLPEVQFAPARVEWCEKKLSFERKRHKALRDLATEEDWLDGKISPLPKTDSVRSSGG